MELTYRGATYIVPSRTVESYETPHEGVFLGARFKLKKSYASRAHRRSYQKPIQLTYRGVDYSR